jgi:xanthine dehydrogenase accessory factor
MREILADLDRWRQAGHRIALARVVEVSGSGPRGPGAAMAVSDRGEVAGSVSGGCVEGAVVQHGLAVLAGDAEPGVVTFGYSDDEAFAVGLTCGGTIRIHVEPMDGWFAAGSAVYDRLRAALTAQRPVVAATVIAGEGIGATLLREPGEEPDGSLGDPDLDRVVARDALAELELGRTVIRHYGRHGEARQEGVTVFIHAFAPPPRMIIFGAVDFTAALARVAKVLGYRVTVCDAREVFATAQRFPMADEVVVEWPQRLLGRIGSELGPRDAVCVLTHDAKFDVPAITAALQTRVGYIGAMGSRRTHAKRLERLREEGVMDAHLERVMAPIGLDLGARTPEETAVSIVAEIIALHTGRKGPTSLRDAEGPIHVGT